jgi:retron-type reverse transcriptase
MPNSQGFKLWLDTRGLEKLYSIVDDLKKGSKNFVGSDHVFLKRYYSNQKTECNKAKTYRELECETIIRQLLKCGAVFSQRAIKGHIFKKKMKKIKKRSSKINGRYIVYEHRKCKPRGITQSTARSYLTQKLILAYMQEVFPISRQSERSYAYQSGKSAFSAIQDLKRDLSKYQYDYIFEYDLESFFDSIPHDVILQKVKTYISRDAILLHAIQSFLCNPIYQLMGKRKYTLKMTYEALKNDNIENSAGEALCGETLPNTIGVVQGGVLSGFLANLVLHDLDLWATKQGNLLYYRYADDFIFLCNSNDGKTKNIIDEKVPQYVKENQLGLSNKTEPHRKFEQFEFLGFRIKPTQQGIRIGLNQQNYYSIQHRFSTLFYNENYYRITSNGIAVADPKKLLPYLPVSDVSVEASQAGLLYFPKWLEVKQDEKSLFIDVDAEINKLLKANKNRSHKYCWFTYFSLVNDTDQLIALSTILRRNMLAIENEKRFSDIQVRAKNKNFNKEFKKQVRASNPESQCSVLL